MTYESGIYAQDLYFGASLYRRRIEITKFSLKIRTSSSKIHYECHILWMKDTELRTESQLRLVPPPRCNLLFQLLAGLR